MVKRVCYEFTPENLDHNDDWNTLKDFFCSPLSFSDDIAPLKCETVVVAWVPFTLVYPGKGMLMYLDQECFKGRIFEKNPFRLRTYEYKIEALKTRSFKSVEEFILNYY